VIDTPNPDKLPPVWVRAASEALQTRSRPDLAWKRNELRKGIDAIGQHYAVPHLAPLMGECRSRQQRNAIVRAAAIAAINDHCPQKDARAVKGQGFVAPYRLGHALRLLTRQRTGNFPSTLPAKRDSVARRLTLLPEMDFDSAVETVSALVSFANTERISINFFDLAKMLFLWGDGLTDNSIDIRNQVLSDYYGAAEAPRKAS
jgi:CRISPR type I-E-associated protein CasB/Cse2